MRLQDSLLRASANNFTGLRLVLASAVIYTHSYVLVHPGPDRDELSSLLGAPVSTYAVDGFFFLSGFLVYPSLMRLKSGWKFLLARLARLWPALMVLVLVTVVAGAFLTSATGVDYLKGNTARFILGNLSLQKGYYTLTGVSCGGAPCNVNQSLWTLPFEMRCYFALMLLGWSGLARPRLLLLVILPMTLVGALLWDVAAVRTWAMGYIGAGPAYVLGDLHRLWPLFILGAIAYVVRDRIILSWWLLAAGLAAVLGAVALHLGIATQVRAAFVGYAVLCLGFLTARKGAASGSWPDFSYGMYIFAAPAMMIAHVVVPSPSHWVLAAESFALSLPAAAASWYLVEKPALEKFRRWASERAAHRAAARQGVPNADTLGPPRDLHEPAVPGPCKART
jgi:peptidoglycan/LPS O-acetylase OafA/YrhL